MKTLSVAQAIALVRRNLDEQGLNESVMYGDENGDNASLDALIAKTLPEAVNEIHETAPVQLLDADSAEAAHLAVSYEPSARSLLLFPGQDYLRLVAFQAADSPVVVAETISEASAEGRKQLNPYTRGTWDKPRIVQLQGLTEPCLVYYSLRSDAYSQNPKAAVAQLRTVSRLAYDESAEGYPVSAELADSIIDRLTAMVLAILGNTDAATYFNSKAIKWKTS